MRWWWWDDDDWQTNITGDFLKGTLRRRSREQHGPVVLPDGQRGGGGDDLQQDVDLQEGGGQGHAEVQWEDVRVPLNDEEFGLVVDYLLPRQPEVHPFDQQVEFGREEGQDHGHEGEPNLQHQELGEDEDEPQLGGGHEHVQVFHKMSLDLMKFVDFSVYLTSSNFINFFTCFSMMKDKKKTRRLVSMDIFKMVYDKVRKIAVSMKDNQKFWKKILPDDFTTLCFKGVRIKPAIDEKTEELFETKKNFMGQTNKTLNKIKEMSIKDSETAKSVNASTMKETITEFESTMSSKKEIEEKLLKRWFKARHDLFSLVIISLAFPDMELTELDVKISEKQGINTLLTPVLDMDIDDSNHLVLDFKSLRQT